jgi:hypothetical protein
LSQAFRIVIYPKDHLPPHLHAILAEYEVMISIVTDDVLEGSVPRAKLKAIQKWLANHREHVARNSRRALPRRDYRGMTYRIKRVEVVRYPVLRVTFDDGLSGEYDLTELIAGGPVFTPLQDEAFFNTVAVGEYGHTFGWNLDDPGQEIDFCPDATRVRIETKIAEQMAERYQTQRAAAD